MATYSELLKDPRWQKMRLKKLEAAGWVCQRCYDDGTTLSVHHKRYVKGRMPWEYPEHELVVLCQPCHEEEHSHKDLRADLMGAMHIDGPASAWEVFSMAAGYLMEQTSDKVLHEIASRFESESPYIFQMGRFMGTLGFGYVENDGFTRMADAMNDPGESEFRNDFLALLEKHGLSRKWASMQNEDVG